MIAVTIGTTSWRAADSLLPGEVEYTGAMLFDSDGVTPLMVWNAGVGNIRPMNSAELLNRVRERKIAAINAECKARLIARYGPAEEQVSRSLGIYGATEQQAMQAGIAATIDASNTASNQVLAAADEAAVEAVTVTWPVI
jgi:hypothetical protein